MIKITTMTLPFMYSTGTRSCLFAMVKLCGHLATVNTVPCGADLHTNAQYGINHRMVNVLVWS